MTSDLRTLGKAMRDAQRAFEATAALEAVQLYPAKVAAEAAFDKALSEPPAALASDAIEAANRASWMDSWAENLVKNLREDFSDNEKDGYPNMVIRSYEQERHEAATALKILSARVGEFERQIRVIKSFQEQLEKDRQSRIQEAADEKTLRKAAEARVARLEAALRSAASRLDWLCGILIGLQKGNGGHLDDALLEYSRTAAKAADEARAALSHTEAKAQGGWRHKKRGTTYDVVGDAELQTSEQLPEGAALVVYRCRETGKLWARPDFEFHDGRFEQLDVKPQGGSHD